MLFYLTLFMLVSVTLLLYFAYCRHLDALSEMRFYRVISLLPSRGLPFIFLKAMIPLVLLKTPYFLNESTAREVDVIVFFVLLYYVVLFFFFLKCIYRFYKGNKLTNHNLK